MRFNEVKYNFVTETVDLNTIIYIITMKKLKFYLLAGIVSCFLLQPTNAQRIQQPLGRGVVAVNNNGSVFISWRKLAQEPEKQQYNIYSRPVGTTDYTKINSSPLNVTNFTTSSISMGSEISVAPIINGIEQTRSQPFTLKDMALRSKFLEITFSNFLSGAYNTKFIWPADLDGDGEYDYVVDRLSLTGETSKIEGYSRFGQHLWTVDMGPNIPISEGHGDMVLAYDINCDGKSEVIIKSSDGTRFYDKANKTWGKFVNGNPTADTDNDGIIDYNTQSVRNPPQYMTVINGLTGEEMNTVEFNYPSDPTGDNYSRNNKADYMSDRYNELNGHCAIAYLDGIHPSIIMEYCDRTIDKTHHYYVSAWGYDFNDATASNWHEKFTWSRNDKTPWPAEFHMIRIGDVDFDGKDEMLEGGYVLNDDGTMLCSAGISHGDRFRVSDIDPDRPGLETYAIQQYAPDMLGQILYDAATATPIKKWYLPNTGDVGRGECIDVDKTHKGYEIWSTMGSLYNSKGDLISSGSVPFPTEGVAWDGELDHELLSAPDKNGYNGYIGKYVMNSSSTNRLIEFSRISNWTLTCSNGVRPAFFGDIIGDWREEIILRKGDETNGYTGIVGFTTDYATPYTLYCLQQNPAYRMQCTCRGYYQSPNTDFYWGYDMPVPPLPPSIATDMVWKNGSEWSAGNQNFIDFNSRTTTSFADGKSVMFDISGNNTSEININGTIKPLSVYAMIPKNKDYTWKGTGTLAGEMELWKSCNGKLTVNCPLSYTGKTYISEGTLELNNSIAGSLELRAKGTLAGNAILNDTVIFEGGLNYEGCRLAPGTANSPFGTITFNKSTTFPGKVYMEMNLQTEGSIKNDLIQVNGSLTMKGSNIFTIIASEEKPAVGEYTLVNCTGALTANPDSFVVRGLKGLSYTIEVKEHSLILNIKGQRAATQGVVWMGSINNNWDYQTENFKLNNQITQFVSGDQLIFNDNAITSNIVLNSLMETSGVTFNNDNLNYTLSGSGGLSSTGGVIKNGKGTLTLSANKSEYTGATIINGGTLAISALADGGTASSIGAATTDASNFQLNHATLTINNANTATNRGITITDTCNINIPTGTTALKGIILGEGKLVKTGAGQVNITYAGANTWTGGTVLNEGTLAMGSWNTTFGKIGGNIEANSGTITIFNNNNTSAVPNFDYATTIPFGKTVAIKAGDRCYINGSFHGAGTINLNMPYVRGDMLADWSDFSGNLNVTGNQLRLCQSTDMSKTTLSLGTGLYAGHYKKGSGTALSANSEIGTLASTATDCHLVNGTYNIGYNNADATFAGILDEVTVNKYGTGNWTLTGQSGALLNIYGGTIYANNVNSTTNKLITINNGGILGGNGAVANVEVKQGGTLTAGATINDCGTLSINGILTVDTLSTLKIKIRKNTNDGFTFSNDATFKGNTILIDISDRSLSAGDAFTVFTGNGLRTGSYNIYPAAPAQGLAWDDSQLLSNGILKVTLNTGINKTDAKGLHIYPTVVIDECYVDATRVCDGDIIIQVFDATGNCILSKNVNSASIATLHLGSFNKGIYIIRITNKNESFSQKITKN